jgi:putative MATE family efflux protein
MFLKKLFLMAIPIAIQTLLFSSKSFVDTFLLADISANDVAATGIIGRVMLVAIVTILGVSAGGGYVAAQCAQDNKKLNSAIITTLIISSVISLLMYLFVTLFDTNIISMFTEDKSVIDLANTYLSIVLFTLVMFSVSAVIATYLRIVEHSTWVSIIISTGVILNILISIILINNYDMGVSGAAYGTLIGTFIEFIAFILFLWVKKINLFKDVSFSKKQFSTIREQIVTSTSSSVVWSLGAFLFYSFLGRSSPDALQAISIIMPVEAILLSLSTGISIASSILIGKALPHESKNEIYKKSISSITLSVLTIFFIIVLFNLFKVDFVYYFSQGNWSNSLNTYLSLMMVGVVIKSLSIQTMNGILRSGGDGNFCMKLDIIMQWVVIIPISYVMLQYGINPLYIYALMLFEEFIKVLASLYRFKSDKWRHDLCAA